MELQLFCILLAAFSSVHARLGLKTSNTALDQALYEEVLDPELCDAHVKYLRTNTFLNLRFIDAGIRVPRGVLLGNGVDLGNYPQCLGIDEITDDYEIKGKYCVIRLPLSQSIELSGFDNPGYNEILNRRNNETHVAGTLQMINHLRGDFERTSADSLLSQLTFRLAVCIPRACSVEQAMTSALFNLTAVGFQFQDDFCRLPNDKPWSPADTVAVILFSIIGLLTILSTCYDLNHIFIRKQDPKEANVLYRSFSVYTNTKRLTTFPSNPHTLQCLDGIRSLAMLWVILGHTFITENFIRNLLDALSWMQSAKSLWIVVAPFTVDTFFFITGILLVYTTAGKLDGKKLLKNLHLFYLNRLFRLFPLLALTVLLQASLFNLMFDGPYWNTVANQVHTCREFWWATLLHIQNYATPSTICLPHSWYIAIDVQLHIVSPIILFWVLNKNRKVAWIALTAILTLVFATTTYYNAYKQFPGNNVVFRSTQSEDYQANYYMNTFTRAAPFVVGMVFGYILDIWKGEKVKIPIGVVMFLWACAFTIFGVIPYAVYEVVQPTFDNLTVDVIMTTYSRSAWAIALGWIIFACFHGYGGPINWFLSLNMWKLPSRLSYAMFLLHYPLQFAINSTALAPVYFSVPYFTFKFLAYASLTFVVSFYACLLFDAPCSVLFKLMLGGGVRKEKTPVTRFEDNILATKDLPSKGIATRNSTNENINTISITSNK